jgi:hypothetical protein
MVRIVTIVALFAATPALAQQAVPLKPGPGADAVTASCDTCHTLGYIRMNSPFLTPEAWKAEVAKMRDAFGAPIDDDVANVIVKYLSVNYGVPPKS